MVAFYASMKLTKLFLISVALFIAACATTSESMEGDYTLTELIGYDAPSEATVSMTITGDRIGGKGPINNWSGALEDGQIGVMMSTKMAGQPEWMKMEMALYTAFIDASVLASGETLSSIKDGKTVAVFKRID